MVDAAVVVGFLVGCFLALQCGVFQVLVMVVSFVLGVLILLLLLILKLLFFFFIII